MTDTDMVLAKLSDLEAMLREIKERLERLERESD